MSVPVGKSVGTGFDTPGIVTVPNSVVCGGREKPTLVVVGAPGAVADPDANENETEVGREDALEKRVVVVIVSESVTSTGGGVTPPQIRPSLQHPSPSQ